MLIFSHLLFHPPPKVDPPSPVVCPIGGRYSFIQNGNGELEMYRTRIRGVTIRPRTQINCRVTVSEFKSCSQDRSKIEVDEEYCETVDYRGRPVGEYGEKWEKRCYFAALLFSEMEITGIIILMIFAPAVVNILTVIIDVNKTQFLWFGRHDQNMQSIEHLLISNLCQYYSYSMTTKQRIHHNFLTEYEITM